MTVSIANKGSGPGNMTAVYEFFDGRVLGRLWFVALTDGASVQLMPPTFHSERAARMFERCVVEHPSGVLISMDGQLELARRIENHLEKHGNTASPGWESLCEGLPLVRQAAQ
jgi:hypothetical protein